LWVIVILRLIAPGTRFDDSPIPQLSETPLRNDRTYSVAVASPGFVPRYLAVWSCACSKGKEHASDLLL
jgi:hypothetical protein